MQCESLEIMKLNCHFNFRISLPLLARPRYTYLGSKFSYVYIYLYTRVYFTSTFGKTDSMKFRIPDLWGSTVLDTEMKLLRDASLPICYFSP